MSGGIGRLVSCFGWALWCIPLAALFNGRLQAAAGALHCLWQQAALLVCHNTTVCAGMKLSVTSLCLSARLHAVLQVCFVI